MSHRSERLDSIRDLIRGGRIVNQVELQEDLRNRGIEVTQATLSRDLKVLGVGKIADREGGYYYALQDQAFDKDDHRELVDDFNRGFLSLEYSGQLGVIRTLSGHADAVAIALERLDLDELVGTVAGDDTLLIVLREGVDREAFTDILRDRFGRSSLA